MRKVATFILILSGTIFTVFVFNIVLYATVPEYRKAINVYADKNDDDIPVVTSSGTVYDEDNVVVLTETDTVPAAKEVEETDASLLAEKAVAALRVETDAVSEKPQIVDKEYHEDCGTKKGYWVITYADGSIGIE